MKRDLFDLDYPGHLHRETNEITGALAVFSGGGSFRYLLMHNVAVAEAMPKLRRDIRTLGVVMLNPSTADAFRADPTIRKVTGFAQRWGYHRILVGNLFGYRATKPAGLKCVNDPVGDPNPYALRTILEVSEKVLAGWGAHKMAEWQAGVFRALVRDYDPFPPKIICLGTTKSGAPRHPLYVPYAVRPVRWPQ